MTERELFFQPKGKLSAEPRARVSFGMGEDGRQGPGGRHKKARCMSGRMRERWQVSAGVCFPFTPLLNASEKR